MIEGYVTSWEAKSDGSFHLTVDHIDELAGAGVLGRKVSIKPVDEDTKEDEGIDQFEPEGHHINGWKADTNGIQIDPDDTDSPLSDVSVDELKKQISRLRNPSSSHEEGPTMDLYQVAAVSRPEDDEENASIVLQPEVLLAESEEKARLKAVQQYLTTENLDEVEVLVRPFV